MKNGVYEFVFITPFDTCYFGFLLVSFGLSLSHNVPHCSFVPHKNLLNINLKIFVIS